MALKLSDITNKGGRGPAGEKGSTGSKGDTGQKGSTGSNGVSPTITTSKSGKTTTVTITDVNGSRTATILDGIDYPTTYQLTALASNNTIEPEGHYTLTMAANTTINATAGSAGYTADAELFVNPGTYTLTAGNNVVLTNSLTASKVNHCVVKWHGTNARITVVDSF